MLARAIEAFVDHWNSDCAPIGWTATADDILAKVRFITAQMERLVGAQCQGDEWFRPRAGAA
jgi:hypothetical protein